MYTRAALLVAMLVLAGAGPVVGLASAADVTLTVTVRTAAGAPVSGAELTASVDDDVVARAETASNGKAFIDVPEGADVTIEVDHRFYVRNSPYRVTDASEEEVLVRVWEKADASVTVVDTDGSVEGVRVTFRKSGDIVEVRPTDAQGTVSLTDIESGEYTLTFFKAGYLRKATSLAVSGETSEEVAIERGSVTVTFRVFDDHFDPPRPIPDATIRADAIGSVPTQPDGQRSVSVPVNTELAVTVEKGGYQPIERTVVVRERDTSVNLTTRRTGAVHLELANERVVVGESVRVTVTDEYGDPVPDATVYLAGDPVGQPDDSGVLTVPVESAGEHALFARIGQLSSDQLSVTGVQPGDGGTGASPEPDGTATGVPDGNGGGLLGDLNLRSTAIGVAAGLVLAAVLFIAVRTR